MNNLGEIPEWSEHASTSLAELLRLQGYALFDEFRSEDLLQLAESLGTPKSDTRSTQAVQSLAPQTSAKSRTNTLSSKYGTGAFPLHTEAAYWPTPPRYLILFCLQPGGGNRPTLLMRPLDVINQATQLALSQELWVVHKTRNPFLCTVFDDRRQLFRYDPECMRPYRSSAAISLPLDEIMTSALQTIHWSRNRILVLDNWRVMHGRGVAVSDDADRILQRVLVI